MTPGPVPMFSSEPITHAPSPEGWRASSILGWRAQRRRSWRGWRRVVGGSDLGVADGIVGEGEGLLDAAGPGRLVRSPAQRPVVDDLLNQAGPAGIESVPGPEHGRPLGCHPAGLDG